MSKPRPPYPEGVRRMILELAASGRSAWDLAQEFEPSPQTIRHWIVQAGIDDGEMEGVTTDDKAELAVLRRENKILREEREILAKAAAGFAEETNTTPRRRSSS